MSIIITILIVLATIVGLLLFLAIFIRKDYTIHREIIIHQPLPVVFDYIKFLRNQDYFNKWVMTDPEMKKTFNGTDGTTGFIYAWDGKKAGQGEQEIKKIVEEKELHTEVRFIKPFEAIGHVKFITESITGDTTRTICTNASAMKYPLNIMLPFVKGALAKDMDVSLLTLKKVLENK